MLRRISSATAAVVVVFAVLVPAGSVQAVEIPGDCIEIVLGQEPTLVDSDPVEYVAYRVTPESAVGGCPPYEIQMSDIVELLDEKGYAVHSYAALDELDYEAKARTAGNVILSAILAIVLVLWSIDAWRARKRKHS